MLSISRFREYDFSGFTRLAWPHRSAPPLNNQGGGCRRAPETARGLVTAHTEVSRIGRKRRGIPVGSVAAVRIVPVGLVGVAAVKLPVGAVASPAVAAAAAGSALALTEPARDAILSSGLEIWRSVERPLS